MYWKERTIEAATYLLDRSGREMPYIKLIKLLYLADREQVRRRGRTISGDTHWSLKCGPVLENTLDAIKHGDSAWESHFATDLDAKVITLRREAPPAELSRADIEVLESISDQFGHLLWPKLVEYTHQLPEWSDTVSRKRIHLRDIAKAVGYDDEGADLVVLRDRERREIRAFRVEIEKTPVHA